MPQPSSDSSSALKAVGLIVGFYATGFAFVALLFYIPSSSLTDGLWYRPAVFILLYLWGGILLVALIPWPTRIPPPPGLLIERHDHPELFRLIDEVAEATEQPLPPEVYLSWEPTARAGERRERFGFRRRRFLGIGLPLMVVLSVAQMKSVLSHEFAHFRRGVGKLDEWVWRTRRSIERSYLVLVHETPGSEPGMLERFFKKPLEWYARAFLRTTRSISREHELACDRVAAHVAGSDVAIDALRRIDEAGLVFDNYMAVDVGPIFSAGYRPPMVEGFKRALTGYRITQWLADLKKQMGEEPAVAQEYDAYPSKSERFAAMEGVAAAGEAAAPAEPPGTFPQQADALSLLADVEAIEAAMFVLVGPGDSEESEMPPISWDESGPEIWKPYWQSGVNFYVETLSGLTPRMCPEAAKDPLLFASHLPPEVRYEMSNADHTEHSVSVLTSSIATALVHDGWSYTVYPGENSTFRKNEKSIKPVPALQKLLAKEMSADEWVDLVVDLGIADVDLGKLADPGEDESDGSGGGGERSSRPVEDSGSDEDGGSCESAPPASHSNAS